MALAAGEQNPPLEELKTVLTSSPSTWQQQATALPWQAKLFGVAACTMIAAFFSAEVASGFAGLVILYWIVYVYQGHSSFSAGASYGANPVTRVPATST